MKFFFYLAPIAFLLSSCGSADYPQTSASSNPGLQAKSSFLLTQPQRDKIARKIWQNESAGQISGLTAWNKGENFPSLGIGHFIWYPKGIQRPFTESFPQFIAFAKQKGYSPPRIAQLADAPWPNRDTFHAQFNNTEMTALRSWFSQNLTVQADFIITKSQAAFGKILQVAPKPDHARLLSNYQKVSATPNGTYALIDYVNFKGEGINPKESYNGQGWGLLQVLQGMDNVPSGQAAAAEFAKAAKRTLGRRITNSPKSKGESRWKSGWFKRCDTYAQPL